MFWLRDTAIDALAGLLRQLPRLRAQESLSAATDHALGAGTLENSGRILRQLEATANGGDTPRRHRRPLTFADLSALGIPTEIDGEKVAG